MTGFFSFTNMSTSTGIKGGEYLINQETIKEIKKYNIKFDLLADEKKEVIKGYKTWGKKKFMGREFMGLIRSTFVIKDQKIIKEWRSVKVKDHALEVLDFIKNH